MLCFLLIHEDTDNTVQIVNYSSPCSVRAWIAFLYCGIHSSISISLISISTKYECDKHTALHQQASMLEHTLMIITQAINDSTVLGYTI